MKKTFIIGTLSIFVASVVFYACEKENSTLNPSVESPSSLVNASKSMAKREFPVVSEQKPKIRVGTHLFERCRYDFPCGPCLGICIRHEITSTGVFEPIDKNNPSKEDFTGTISLINEHQIKLSLEQKTYIDIGNGTTIIEYNVPIDSRMVASLGAKQIVVKKGTYKIDYTKNKYGDVIFDVIMK